MDKLLTGAIIAMSCSIIFELFFESWHVGLLVGVFLGFLITQYEEFKEIISFIKRGLKK